MNMSLELMMHIAERRFLSDDSESFGFFNPYTDLTRVINPKTVPTHYTTEGGGTYSARPDLARFSPAPVYGAGFAILYAGPPVLLAGANYAVIRSAPEEQQKGLWQMFYSGLTGTFGVGSAGQQFV